MFALIGHRVQHDVVSGLKYLQVVKRKGVRGNSQIQKKKERGPLGGVEHWWMIWTPIACVYLIVDKTEEMIGSYGPQANCHEKKFQLEEAPSGMLARGHYEAKVRKIIQKGDHAGILKPFWQTL